MRDEINTPIDMPVEREPEQPFFDAIHENIDVTRVPHRMLRSAAKACLALAEEMSEEAVTHARESNRTEMAELRKATGEEISALTNMVRERDSRINDMDEENQKLSACIDRLTAECLAHIDEHARIAAENKATIDNLEKTLVAANDHVNRLTGELERIEDAYKNKCRELDKAETVYTDAGNSMTEELSVLRKTHARLIEDNKKLWADNTELKSDLSSATARNEHLRRIIADLATHG